VREFFFKRATEVGWLRVILVCLALGRFSSAFAATGGDADVHDHLYATSFPTSTDGWVVGAFGSIYNTTDTGATWQAQSSGVLQPLFDVDFVDAQQGWAVGRLGVILHTSDGGATWSAQKSGIDKHLFAVDFFDARHGIAAGDWGVILATDDGGATWRQRDLGEDVILNGVAMVDADTAFIVGELGTILRSDDGGANWQRLETEGLPTPLVDMVWALAVAPDPGRPQLYLGTTGGDLYLGEPGGQSWRKAVSGLPVITQLHALAA